MPRLAIGILRDASGTVEVWKPGMPQGPIIQRGDLTGTCPKNHIYLTLKRIFDATTMLVCAQLPVGSSRIMCIVLFCNLPYQEKTMIYDITSYEREH